MYVKLSTEKTSVRSKLKRIDWVGGLFFIGGLTSFLVGISWAGVQFEWKSAQAIAPMVIGIASVIVAIIWEYNYAMEPFLRPSLFHSTSALATYICALFQGFIVCVSLRHLNPVAVLAVPANNAALQLFCALYYIPFYFTAIRFRTPTQSGLDIFPVTCFLLPVSIVISLITTRIGRYRWAIWSGWVVTTIGCGLLVLLDDETKTPVWAVILAVFGIGHGILLTSVNVGIQAVSRVEDAGRAAAMYAFMRTMGMSIGVAVGGTVFQNVMSSKLDDLGLPRSIAQNSEAFVTTMSLMDPEDPIRVGAVKACKLACPVLWGSGVLMLTHCSRSGRIPRRVLDHHSRVNRIVRHQPGHQEPQHEQVPRIQVCAQGGQISLQPRHGYRSCAYRPPGRFTRHNPNRQPAIGIQALDNSQRNAIGL